MISVLWIYNPKTRSFEFARRGKSVHLLMMRSIGAPFDSIPRGWFEIQPNTVEIWEYITCPHYKAADAWVEYVRRNHRFEGRDISYHHVGAITDSIRRDIAEKLQRIA